MILEVRRACDGTSDNFWSDTEITDWLNEGAKVMASDAQPIQAVKQITTVANQQEYDLGQDVDEIYGVSYLKSSVQYPLNHIDQRAVQIGSSQTGTPVNFYTRQVTTQTSNQGTNGAITVANTSAEEGTTVLGLHPVPSTTGEVITVLYFGRHMTMIFPKDKSPIPLEFQRGIVAYATAMAKIKDEAYGEANTIFFPMFEQFKERLKQKMTNRGQEMGFPKVKIVGDDRQSYGGSSVIFIDTAS